MCEQGANSICSSEHVCGDWVARLAWNPWPQFPHLHAEGRDAALSGGAFSLWPSPVFSRALPPAQRGEKRPNPGGQGGPSPALVAPQGWYLVRGPRLLVGPVPVAPHVPPLDLQRVGGGTAAAEGAGHLHVLARPRRHVVGRLCEQGCVEKGGGMAGAQETASPGAQGWRVRKGWGEWERPGFRRGPWTSSARLGKGCATAAGKKWRRWGRSRALSAPHELRLYPRVCGHHRGPTQGSEASEKGWVGRGEQGGQGGQGGSCSFKSSRFF